MPPGRSIVIGGLIDLLSERAMYVREKKSEKEATARRRKRNDKKPLTELTSLPAARICITHSDHGYRE